MAKFNEYPAKTTPEDNDTLMIYDAAAKANKLSPFSGIWNWIVEKLTNAVIANLQTNNKTVLGAINELNSNRIRTGFSGVSSFYSSPSGIYMLTSDDYRNIPDKPDNSAGRAIWIYCQSGDERIGLLMSARNGKIAVGYCYGDTKLNWKEL